MKKDKDQKELKEQKESVVPDSPRKISFEKKTGSKISKSKEKEEVKDLSVGK